MSLESFVHSVRGHFADEVKDNEVLGIAMETITDYMASIKRGITDVINATDAVEIKVEPGEFAHIKINSNMVSFTRYIDRIVIILDDNEVKTLVSNGNVCVDQNEEFFDIKEYMDLFQHHCFG